MTHSFIQCCPPRTSSLPLGPNIPRSPPVLEPLRTMFLPFSTRHQVITATHTTTGKSVAEDSPVCGSRDVESGLTIC